MSTFLPEMTLFDAQGRRLYLDAREREAFWVAALEERPPQRVFSHLVHYTGCHPSEALELTPERILFNEQAIVFRTLKKRPFDKNGNRRKPHYRSVLVPARLINDLDLAFDVRQLLKNRRARAKPLWDMSRPSAWRMVKRVMARAGIEGPQATTKGMRHGVGVALAQAKTPATAIRDILGHADTKTTEIYTKAVGEELRNFVQETW